MVESNKMKQSFTNLNNNNNDNDNTDTNSNNNNNNNTDTNNDNNNNTDTNNNNNDNNDNNTDRGEWKIQLSIIISCISTKRFNEKRTMHLKSKAVEVFMGRDTVNVIDTLFNTLL